jgi:mannose/cellobiose epimerase-like protein (N-acyl-D-glucosamine 2-epimerase family)
MIRQIRNYAYYFGLVLLTSALLPAIANAQAPLKVTDAAFWRQEALKDLIPYYYQHIRDDKNGGFQMNLSRTWQPMPPWEKTPAFVSRQVFGFTAAYMLSGDEKYLDVARDGANYLYAHAWDSQYGGWYDKLTATGEPLTTTKTVALQLYTNVGLTTYYFATGDERALALVKQSVEIQRTRAYDPEFGGYAQVLNRDLTVLDYGKNKHAHFGYAGSLLLNLYLATGDPAILKFDEELMDLSMERMRDQEGWLHGFRNRFDRKWVCTPVPAEGKNVVSVGAELTGVLAALRLYHQSGDKKYLDFGKSLGDKVTRYGFSKQTGAWDNLLEAAYPYRHLEHREIAWWVQIYGSFLQLQLFRVTGDPQYIENFRKSEEYFERNFRDHEQGGVYNTIRPDGTVVDGNKASDWRTSYHEMEHALLVYLYLNLYVHRTPAVLHFKLDGPREDRVSYVDDPTVRIAAVKMDGKPWQKFDAAQRRVTIPEGKGHIVVVTFAPPSRSAANKVAQR